MTSKQVKCIRCNKAIDATDQYEKYEGKIYHSDCFKCSHGICGIILTSETVNGFNKMPYCSRHVPDDALGHRPSTSDNSSSDVAQSSFDESIQQNPSNIPSDLIDNEYEEIESSSPLSTNITEEKNTARNSHSRKKMGAVLKESSSHMVEDIFSGLARDMHIVVCGSPRVGKSTLINAICGREVAQAREGLGSVTQSISCHTMEGECNTGSDIVNYKYNFWDTPGFESWDKDNIRSKVKQIIDKPETKPLCMIFCASPGTFVDLTQLEWLLNLCINKRHIFCALVCTNKYAGQAKNRRAVLEDFNKLLSKYVNDSPRNENDITFYGNIGLCAAVNSEPYEDDDRILASSGINELIYGIMESLVDEQVLNWCFLVLENQGFWNDCQQKINGFLDGFKGRMKTLKTFLDGKNKQKVRINKISYSTK